MGLQAPVLVAMEDAPGKPDPTGLFESVRCLEPGQKPPVIYVGDTVADMYTIAQARKQCPDRAWIAVGVLPPHVQQNEEQRHAYINLLLQAGAEIVLSNVQELTSDKVFELAQLRAA